jgi:hypothetical protein
LAENYVFSSFRNRASVAGQVAVDSELPAELPPFHGFPFRYRRPFPLEESGPFNLPLKSLDDHFLMKYPQFYYRELPDYRFYLP